MTDEFELILIDRDDLEYLAAEILFKGQRLCQIYREENKGERGKVLVEYLTDVYLLGNEVKMCFDLQKFLSVLDFAQKAIDQEPLVSQDRRVGFMPTE